MRRTCTLGAVLMVGWLAALELVSERDQDRDERPVVRAVRQLAEIPDLAWVMFDGKAALEAFSDGDSSVHAEGDYVSVEHEAWHMHLEAPSVTAISCNESSWAVQLRDREGKAILSVYFMEMIDDDGRVDPDRRRRYRAFCTEFASETV